MTFYLPVIEPPYTKSWRCLWYRPDWPFWKKHAFLHILAAHKQGNQKWVIKYGKNHDGIIDACHLRSYVARRSWKRAACLLDEFLDELMDMGVLAVVSQASRDQPMVVAVNEERLEELSANIADLFPERQRRAARSGAKGRTGWSEGADGVEQRGGRKEKPEEEIRKGDFVTPPIQGGPVKPDSETSGGLPAPSSVLQALRLRAVPESVY